MSKSSASKRLYLQVLAAMVVGAALGHFQPKLAKQMKTLGDGFVKLVRMLIAPINFLAVAATIFVTWWEGTLDLERARAMLGGQGGQGELELDEATA